MNKINKISVCMSVFGKPNIRTILSVDYSSTLM